MREQQVRERAQARDSRRRLAEMRRQEIAEKTREKTEAKLDHSRSVRTDLETYERARQAQVDAF